MPQNKHLFLGEREGGNAGQDMTDSSLHRSIQLKD